MKYISSLIIFIAVAFISATVSASQWKIDKDHSEIRFQVNHILTSVSGTFADFNGEVVFDPKHPSDGKFDFTVNVKSIDTNNGKRDNHLRSKDFFNADEFPKMRFISSAVSHVKDNIYKIKGEMTIKDVTKEMAVEFEFLGPQAHPFDKKKQVGGFVTRFTVPRLDYHVGNGKFLKMGVVGKDVDVQIVMEALTDK